MTLTWLNFREMSTSLQQHLFKTSQKIVFLATLLNRLFGSNNAIRIDLKNRFFLTKLELRTGDCKMLTLMFV